MIAVAYPADMQDGKVHTLAQRELHRERWSNWLFQSNRRIAQRFKKGLAERYGLNEGAYFRILVYSDDSSFPRYRLTAVYANGDLRIIN